MKTSQELLLHSFEKMLETSKPNELGKLFAHSAETFAKEWINENTSVNCYDRPNLGVENNQGGYDLVTESGLRVQVKMRSRTLHLENTRRNSEKNKGAASKSGHVAYSDDEFDVAIFVRPGSWLDNEPSDWNDTSKWECLAVPVESLKDDSNPGFLKRNISKKVIHDFKDIGIETIEALETKNLKCAA